MHELEYFCVKELYDEVYIKIVYIKGLDHTFQDGIPRWEESYIHAGCNPGCYEKVIFPLSTLEKFKEISATFKVECPDCFNSSKKFYGKRICDIEDLTS